MVDKERRKKSVEKEIMKNNDKNVKSFERAKKWKRMGGEL
jgi:hypothetical protein